MLWINTCTLWNINTFGQFWDVESTATHNHKYNVYHMRTGVDKSTLTLLKSSRVWPVENLCSISEIKFWELILDIYKIPKTVSWMEKISKYSVDKVASVKNVYQWVT